MEDDECVVFENSPLYQHLQDVGFSTEDVQPEKIHQPLRAFTAKKIPSEKQSSAGDTLKKQLVDYVFDESWQNLVRHLCIKSTNQIIEDALKNSALREEDAAYVESYAASLGYDRTEEQGYSVMGQMMTHMAVLAVTMGYGLFRMFYAKPSDLSTSLYFYAVDILCVILTVVALLPDTIKFAMAGRLVGRLQCLNDTTTLLLKDIGDFQRLVKKAKLFIRESELIKQGFTMVTAPISRLESGLNAAMQRQCPALRRTIFHHARKVTIDFREATVMLFSTSSQPASNSENGFSSKNLSHLETNDSWPFTMIDDADDEDQIAAATDNFCLESLKLMIETMDVHMSEFFRVLCLLCLMQSSNYSAAVKGFSEQLEAVKLLSRRLKGNHQPIKNDFLLHKELQTKMAAIDAKDAKRKTTTASPSGARILHLGVHSLRLHLLSAAERLQPLDEKLESLSETAEDASAYDLNDLRTGLNSDLTAIGHHLSAIKDCVEDLTRRLQRQAGDKPADAGNSNVASNTTFPKDPADVRVNISVISDCDPVSEDQVFEGYPDEADDSSAKHFQLPEDEERCNPQEAVHVLAELRTVIAVRAEEMQKREEAALLKMEASMDKTCRTSTAAGHQDASQDPDPRTDAVDEPSISKVSSSVGGLLSEDVSSSDFGLRCSVNSFHAPRERVTEDHDSGATLSNSFCVSSLGGGISNNVPDEDTVRTEQDTSRNSPLEFPDDAEMGECISGSNLASNNETDSFITGLSSSAIARMAVAKSNQMAALNIETFGDNSSEGDDDDDEDDEDYDGDEDGSQ